MTDTYAVYARFIVEADDETAASFEVTDILKDVPNVDEVWVEAKYEG